MKFQEIVGEDEKIIDSIYGEYIGSLSMVEGGLANLTRDYPCIHYISGIENFDNLLAGKTFGEVKGQFGIDINTNGLLISIMFPKRNASVIGIPKNQIIKITSFCDQRILVRKENWLASKLDGSGSLLPGFGLLGMAVGGLIKRTRGNAPVEIDGSVYELCIRDKNDEEHIIKFGSQNESVDQVNGFFKKHLSEFFS